MLQAKNPMEVDKQDGKRQPDEDHANSPPNKRRQEGKQKTQPGKSRGKGKPGSSSESHKDDNLLRAMSALTLRHEDSINTLQADLSFVSYLETPGRTAVSAIPVLAAVQQAHQQNVDTRPLRQKLFTALMEHPDKQIQRLVADQEMIQAGVKDGLLQVEGSSQVHFAFQKWDSSANTLIMDKEAQPVHTKDLLMTIREIMKHNEVPGAISRFQISRSLTKDMSGGPVRVQIQISQISEPAFRTLLQKLVGCTAWTLIGANFRKGDVRRSPLAVQVEKLSRKEASSPKN